MNICLTLSYPRPMKPYYLNTIIISCPSPFKSMNQGEILVRAAIVKERSTILYDTEFRATDQVKLYITYNYG
jgi:hypothetical protein